MSENKFTTEADIALIEKLVKDGRKGNLDQLLKGEKMRQGVDKKRAKIEHILDQGNQVDLYKFYGE